MSKGLEALEKGFWKLTHKGNINYYNTIEKELKALEIIREKKVNCSHLINDTLEDYNSTWSFEGGEKYQLTQEEYDLLKEVLL